MPSLKTTGRLMIVAMLAASTTLSGSPFAYAGQASSFRVAQASDDEAPAAEPKPGAAAKGKRKGKPEAETQSAAEAQPVGKKPRSGKAIPTDTAADAPAAAESPVAPLGKTKGPKRNAARAVPADEPVPAADAGPDAVAPSAKRKPVTAGKLRGPVKATAAATASDAPEADAPLSKKPQRGTADTRRKPKPDTDPAAAAKPAPAGTAESASDSSAQGATRAETPSADALPTKRKPKPAPANAETPATANPAPVTSKDAPEAAPQEAAAPKKPAPDTADKAGDEAGGTAKQAETSQSKPDRKARGDAAADDASADTSAPPAPGAKRKPKPVVVGGEDDATPGKRPAADAADADAPAADVPAGSSRADTAPDATDEDGGTRSGNSKHRPRDKAGRSTSDLTPAVPGRETPKEAADAEAAASARPVREKPKPVPVDVQTTRVKRGEIDQSDARVQTLDQPVTVRSVTLEQGERLQRAPDYDLPPETRVVKRDKGRDIIAIAGAAVAGAAVGAAGSYFIRSNDDDRLAADSRDRYVERLPRGRTRETIERPNGSKVVTISNEYGDVVQRSRITPDGREVVLFYDPHGENDARRPDYFEDPGDDLPPVEVNIPRDRYIVDTDQPDEELYYDTISAPPVETVGRIYSIEEVRRSPRIRAKVRRIDLNTINFDFGSATIPQTEVKNLQALADAVSRVIKDNPGETFLIEGHTDAVGSNVANLTLSDQRAEAVASALSQYFDIPAENLVTQGYGEEDLKVDTQGPERENRRVTFRRITSLVKPLTSADAE